MRSDIRLHRDSQKGNIMRQPTITKRLTLIAAILCGAGMLLQLLIVLVAPPLLHAQNSYMESMPGVCYALLLTSICLHVPFLILALLSWRREELTRRFAWITVLGGAGAYLFGGVIGSLLVNALGFILIRRFTGLASYSIYSMVRSYMGFPGILYTAALVFLCCAGAIELYITSHQNSTPSDGGKEELP